MMEASRFYSQQPPVEIMHQVAAMLDFISEALSGLAVSADPGLSSDGLEGLATLCLHLKLITQEAAGR